MIFASPSGERSAPAFNGVRWDPSGQSGAITRKSAARRGSTSRHSSPSVSRPCTSTIGSPVPSSR